MNKKGLILVVNASSNAGDHIAASLSQQHLLSSYIRPYVNKSRWWERQLFHSSRVGTIFRRTFGRRSLVPGLDASLVVESALIDDFLLGIVSRRFFAKSYGKRLVETLIGARTRAIGDAGARAISGEMMVIASWGCAKPVFEIQKHAYGLCVLNYPYAHHRFTRRILDEESKLEPDFAATLNGHITPPWLQERLDREIEMADHILLGSSFAKQSFIEEGIDEKKLVVIPYGSDTSIFHPDKKNPKPKDEFRVLFVGQIGQRKGISYLLRAYKQFQKPTTQLTLVGEILGDGTAIHPYRSLFTHIPHVPRPELAKIYANADIFVFPTLIEGLGLVVLEAMASGLPVITTTNGPDDIVRDGVDGFVIGSRDQKAILQYMLRLYDDQDLRLEMGRNARERASQFSWNRYRHNIAEATKSWIGLS